MYIYIYIYINMYVYTYTYFLIASSTLQLWEGLFSNYQGQDTTKVKTNLVGESEGHLERLQGEVSWKTHFVRGEVNFQVLFLGKIRNISGDFNLHFFWM